MNEQYNQLLCRCALHDYKAFQQLYNLTSAKLFAIAKRILSNDELAEDALQEAMIKVWHNSDKYQPDRSNAMTWMARIVRNQSLDILRSRTRINNKLDASIEVESLNSLLSGNFVADHDPSLSISVQTCIDKIQQQQKLCINMIFLMGHTYKEVGNALDKPIGTVKGWVHRGLKELRKCLDH